MTDYLRTRIAAAIMESCHGVYLDDAVNAADAVIRALGWKQQWRADLGYDGYSNCPSRDQAAELVDDFNSDHPYLPEGEQGIVKHRYVTEWQADE